MEKKLQRNLISEKCLITHLAPIAVQTLPFSPHT